MLRTKFVDNIRTFILSSVTFLKNRAFYEIMWKNMGQATDGNMAHPHCMLDT